MSGGNWVVEVNEIVKHMPDPAIEMDLWRKRSIYRLPAQVTGKNMDMYKPQVASFGPYHHGESRLRPMEDHKKRALYYFLKRSGKPVEHYYNALTEVVEVLQDSYDQLEEPRDTDEFLQIMLLDGCFILEIIRATVSSYDYDYAPSDPIFSSHGKLHTVPSLRRDMLLLENQIPLLVLVVLHSAEHNKALEVNEDAVKKLIQKFFFAHAPVYTETHTCFHILDVYRKQLIFEGFSRRPRRRARVLKSANSHAPTATELHEAGIRLRRSRIDSLKSISFRGKVLRIPPMVVDEETVRIVLNMMAFERSHVGAGYEVTAYIFFMNSIIKSAQDIVLLERLHIINNLMGSDRDAVRLFRSLSKEITLDPDMELNYVYALVNYRLRNIFRKRWNECFSNLMNTYFKSPWAIISVIAASLALTLSAIQTLYTVLGYFNGGK